MENGRRPEGGVVDVTAGGGVVGVLRDGWTGVDASVSVRDECGFTVAVVRFVPGPDGRSVEAVARFTGPYSDSGAMHVAALLSSALAAVERKALDLEAAKIRRGV
jgi:hypothetical protein